MEATEDHKTMFKSVWLETQLQPEKIQTQRPPKLSLE